MNPVRVEDDVNYYFFCFYSDDNDDLFSAKII